MNTRNRSGVRGELDVLCGLVARTQICEVAEVAEPDCDDCGDWHRQEGADDAEDTATEQNDQQDDCGVQVHSLGLQDWGEDVALDLLDSNDDEQYEDCCSQAVGDECDYHCNEAGGERTDNRNEASEESHHGQDHCQRHIQNRKTGTDEDRVDKRNDSLRADVARQRVPGPGEHLREVPAEATSGQAAEPGEEVLAVFDEEECQHQHGHHGHGDR